MLKHLTITFSIKATIVFSKDLKMSFFFVLLLIYRNYFVINNIKAHCNWLRHLNHLFPVNKKTAATFIAETY